MGISSKNKVLNDLFDIKSNTTNEDYLTYIDILVSKISHFSEYYSEDYFLNNHTASPIYTPFINSGYSNKLYALDIFLKSRNRYTWDIPIKENLYYCNDCVKENLEEFGECYWNRIFQLPGVMVCTKHKRALSKSQFNILKNPLNRFIMPDQDKENSEEIKIDNEIFEQLSEIAINVEYFFYNQVKVLNYIELFEKYFEFIKIVGIAVPLSKFKKKLGELILLRFSQETLDYFNSNPQKNDWLLYLNKDSIHKIHPIRHVLLMMTLAQSVEMFMRASPKYQPFGNGPWICMNPLSDHYLEKVISKVDVHYILNKRNFYGEFNCKCGFSYALKVGERSPLEIKNFHYKVKKKGELWEKEFDALVRKGLTIEEIAKKAQLSKPTVRRLVKEGHDSLVNRKKNRLQLQTEEIQNQTKVDKETWIELRRTFPNYSRSELINESPNLYKRLNKRDKEWLRRNLPLSKRGVKKTGKGIYHRRDLNYLKEAKAMMNNWSLYEKQAGHIIKRTQNKIYPRLGIALVTRSNYPLTNAFISSVLESTEDFQIRLINQCIEKYFLNKEIKRYRLLELSGLRKLQPRAEKYLENIIEKSNTI